MKRAFCALVVVAGLTLLTGCAQHATRCQSCGAADVLPGCCADVPETCDACEPSCDGDLAAGCHDCGGPPALDPGGRLRNRLQSRREPIGP
jgi:hypothetical protein